jgi:hypothetical protein
LETREDNFAHARFKEPVGFSQNVIQPGAFLEFLFVHVLCGEEDSGRLAAGSPERIDFEGELGGSTDWKSGVTFS